MKCKKVEKLLVAYIEKELGDKEKEIVEQHLALCPKCREKVEELNIVSEVIKSIPRIKLEEDLVEKIKPVMSKTYKKEKLPLRPVLSPMRPVLLTTFILLIIAFISYALIHKYVFKPEKEIIVKKEKRIEKRVVKKIPKEEIKKRIIVKKIEKKEEIIKPQVEEAKKIKPEPEKEIVEKPEEIIKPSVEEVEEIKPTQEVEIIETPIVVKEEEIRLEEKVEWEEKIEVEEEIVVEEEITVEEKIEEIEAEKEVKKVKIATTPVIIQEKTPARKEGHANVVWGPPKRTAEEVKPEEKGKKRAILPTTAGTLGFDYQLNKTADKVQKKITFARNLNVNWERPLSANQSIQMSLVRNEQDVTNAKQAALTGVLTYNTPYGTFTVNKNIQENETRAATGNSISKNDTTACNLDIKALEKIPINLSYNEGIVSTIQGGSLSSKNKTNTFNLTTSPNIFNKITTAITLAMTDTEDLLKNSKTKTHNIGMNLSYPVYRFLTLNLGLQRNESKSLPQDITARTKTEGVNTILGLTSNITPALALSLNLTQSSNKNYTATGVVETKPTNLASTLNYKISKNVNLTTSHNLSKTKGGPSTQTLNSSVTFAPPEKLTLIKGVTLNLQQNTSKDKDGNLQSKTNQIGINTTHQIVQNLDLQTNFNSSTQTAQKKTETKNINIGLNNKLGKSFTHSATIGTVDTNGAGASSKTNNYGYNASYPYTITIGKKQIPINLTSTITRSSVDPQGTKNTNTTVNYSLQYPISPSIQTNYSLSKTNNTSKLNGKPGTSNSTLNHTFGLTFKTGRLPEFGLNLNLALAETSSGSTSTANANMFYSYKIFEKIKWNYNLAYSETKQQGKRTPNYVFTTGLGYEF